MIDPDLLCQLIHGINHIRKAHEAIVIPNACKNLPHSDWLLKLCFLFRIYDVACVENERKCQKDIL